MTSERSTVEAGPWEVSNADYHADASVIGSSMMEDFRESPQLFWGRYVAGTIPRKEPTKDMRIGTALHAWVLQRETFESEILVAATINRGSKAGKAAWESAESTKRTPIDEDEFETVKLMAASVERNELARDLLAAPGRSELSVRWTHTSGIRCKARYDKLLDGCGIILDLKTTNDPGREAWVRTMADFGTHRQAAHYLTGSHFLDVEASHYHVVFGRNEPFEVFIYELDEQSLSLGRRQNEETLQRLAACLESNNWLHPFANQVTPVGLPKWALMQE